MKTSRFIRTGVFAATFFAFSLSVVSLPAQAKGEDKFKPGRQRGLIVATKHVVNLKKCINDQLSIKVKIPRKLKAFWQGNADAHIVVAFPSNNDSGQTSYSSWNLRELLADKLQAEDGDKREHPLFRLPCSTLASIPAGPYQLALVMTIPGGDPENINDWFHGFQGLVATSRIKISEGEDESDKDGDGEVDGDLNHDGEIDDHETDSSDESNKDSDSDNQDEMDDPSTDGTQSDDKSMDDTNNPSMNG